MQEVVFRVKKSALAWRVGLLLPSSVGIVLFGWWRLSSISLFTGSMVLVKWLLIGIVAAAFAYVLARPVRLLFVDAGLIIGQDGLTDHTAGLGFIPWHNVSGFKRSRPGALSRLEIELVDYRAFLNELGPVSRFLWTRAKARDDLSPGIITTFLHDGDEVENVLDKARRTV